MMVRPSFIRNFFREFQLNGNFLHYVQIVAAIPKDLINDAQRYLLPEKILAKRYFSRVENICRDNKVREFYFKLLHRIVVSKRELFTYGIAKHVLCPYCKQNDSIIHTFCNCHRTKWIFSEVIKWFNDENATSFALFSGELIFGLNNDRKNQSSSEIVKKFDFTLLFAKYYLYTNKLAPKKLSLD